jgi:hypothetical protein
MVVGIYRGMPDSMWFGRKVHKESTSYKPCYLGVWCYFVKFAGIVFINT